MKAHNFNGVLHAKGMFVYCKGCGLVKLGNRESVKAAEKPCQGLRDLDDEQYLKLKGVSKSR